MDKRINKLISFKIKGFKEIVEGIVLDIGRDFTLLQQITNDYIIDGYKILNHQYITNHKYDADDKFKEKVIKLKSPNFSTPKMSLDNLPEILMHVSDEFGAFSLDIRGEPDAIYVGTVNKIQDDTLIMQFLSPKGIWKGKVTFPVKDIVSVTFNSDYINSLMLIPASKKKKA